MEQNSSSEDDWRSPPFMEPEGSLPRSNQTKKSDESSPHLSLYFSPMLSHVVSFLHLIRHRFCTPFSSLPSVPHTLL